MAANKSGLHLEAADIPIVLGMSLRGDRKHDIAAWFGVNQGRVAEAERGKYGTPAAASVSQLPPKGPPGIKGRRLREAATTVARLLDKSDVAAAREALKDAVNEYDSDEV